MATKPSVITAIACSTSTLCIGFDATCPQWVLPGADSENRRYTAVAMPHNSRDPRRKSAQVREMRIALPVTLDQWVATQAHAVGLSKSAFVRMIVMQFKAHSDEP